jgi:hypothetical protein
MICHLSYFVCVASLDTCSREDHSETSVGGHAATKHETIARFENVQEAGY